MFQYRRYRAPAENGETFFDPPREQGPSVVSENIQRRRTWSVQLHGEDLASVVDSGRHELRQLAADYTRQYRDLPAALDSHSHAPLIMAGHQPELFHVGVWFKNFWLDRLARRVQGLAINLIVDNDLISSPSIRVPAGSVEDPRIETVAYDQPTLEIPYEERRLLDRASFESFAKRIEALTRPYIKNPVVQSWWPRVVEVSREQPNLGRCIAQARHQLELDWGLNTLELPVSAVCQTLAFRQFVLHLLGDLPRLYEIYNESLRRYRRVNHIRSRSHPVPALERFDDWLEVPLWVWTHDDPRRRRLFARHRQGEIEITNRKDPFWTIKGREGQADLARLAEQGVKIRPRALVTTMFSRLVLCDLFVHGIGGGKYDQLTDGILQRWFGIEPPSFQVATATAHLPIARPRVTSDSLRDVERILRELTFNPDRHIAQPGPADPIIAEKKNWLGTALNWTRRPQHLAITRLNAELQEFVAERRAKLESERERLKELLRHERLLGSREFAFCLFPNETLQPLLLDNA